MASNRLKLKTCISLLFLLKKIDIKSSKIARVKTINFVVRMIK